MNTIAMEKLNPYTARVDRAHPTAFIFLIDQSGSMEEELSQNETKISKHELVAVAINKLLDEILNRCTKPEEIRHYFDIALIGYGKNSDEANFISFGENSKEDWLSPEELKSFARYKKASIEQNIRGKIKTKEIDMPYWVEPIALYRTPMYNAFAKAKDLLEQWCEDKSEQDCYPPVVINITDGIQTDAEDEDMVAIAHELMNLGTMDGNVLVFNIHLDDDNDNEGITFPSSNDEIGEDSYSQMLFNMSSTLPKIYNKDIERLVNRVSVFGFKAMGYKKNIEEFIAMLNIGTITNMAEDYDE